MMGKITSMPGFLPVLKTSSRSILTITNQQAYYIDLEGDDAQRGLPLEGIKNGTAYAIQEDQLAYVTGKTLVVAQCAREKWAQWKIARELALSADDVWGLRFTNKFLIVAGSSGVQIRERHQLDSVQTLPCRPGRAYMDASNDAILVADEEGDMDLFVLDSPRSSFTQFIHLKAIQRSENSPCIGVRLSWDSKVLVRECFSGVDRYSLLESDNPKRESYPVKSRYSLDGSCSSLSYLHGKVRYSLIVRFLF